MIQIFIEQVEKRNGYILKSVHPTDFPNEVHTNFEYLAQALHRHFELEGTITIRNDFEVQEDPEEKPS